MICSLCQGDETEGGDRLCACCRERLGEDDAGIDRAISHRAANRSLRLTHSLYLHTITNMINAEKAS